MNVHLLTQKFRIVPQVGSGTPVPTSIELEGPLSGINTLGDVANILLRFVIPLAVIILFLIFIWSGYDYLLSRGNPEKIKSAQAKLMTGIIGFVLLIASYFIVKLLSSIFGLGGGIL